MRESLDHCVKCTICETFCPVVERHAAVPGPEVRRARRPSASASPDEPSPDASLDYCSGCGICTQVCPQGVHIAEINTQARAKLQASAPASSCATALLARPDLGRPARHAGGAGRQLDAGATGSSGGSSRGRSASHRGAAVPKLRRAHVPGAGRASTPRRRRRGAWPTSTAAARTGTSRDMGEMTVELLEHTGCQVEVPRGQRCCGLPAQSNGLFDDGAQVRAADGGEAGAVGARGRRHRRDVDELHADAQARGAARSSSWADDAELRTVVSDACTTSASTCSRCTSAASCETDFAPLPMTVTYHAPCQQQGHGIGKPALDLMALVPELRVDREGRDVLRRRRDLRAQEREVRHRDEGRRGPVRPDRRRARPTSRCATPRRAAGTSRRRPASAPCTRSRSCTAPPGLLGRAWSASSSCRTAPRWPRAWSSWRARWAATRCAIEAAGGMADPTGAIGTDAELVLAAIERAASPDGVLVLMDLGSAVMSAEMAVEMVAMEDEAGCCCARRRWSRAPSPRRRGRARARRWTRSPPRRARRSG